MPSKFTYCCKQGCKQRLTVGIDDLEQPPEPCAAPHVNQYAEPVFQGYVDLVDQLRLRRRALGLSQEDITEASGLSDGHINKLEALHRIAQFDTLVIWANTLGLAITLSPAKLPPDTAARIGSEGAGQR